MPYSTVQGHAECNAGEVAVVKDEDGEVMGCHASEEAALDQIAALEASEEGRQVDLEPPAAMVSAAELGLEKKEELGLGDCGTGEGETTARQITDGEIAESRIRDVAAYLVSHAEDYPQGTAPSDLSDEQIEDGCGVVQYLLWGGGTDTAYNWALRKANEVAEENGDSMPYDESDMRSMRADPEDLSNGDLVRWQASGGTAYGQIDEVVTDGEISAEPEGPTMEGTEDEPAYGVRVYDQNAEGEWEPTDTLTVHRAGALTVIDDFPESRAVSGSYRAVLPGANIRATDDEDTVTVQFMTENVARDGMVLDADGIDTEAFEENPVVLWSHGTDPRRGDEPIAKASNLRRSGDGMLADVTFAGDEFAQRIREKVRNGFVNAVSIGWRTEDMERDGDVPTVTRADMTEFSFVAVPADTEALVQERTAGSEVERRIERLEQKIDRLTDNHDTRGQSLASTLEDAISDMASEDMPASDIQSEMADAAGIEGSTLDGILGADIQCPPIDRLEGFADVLDISLDTIISAAEDDGCEYDRSTCNCDSRAQATATSPQPKSADEGTPSSADDESRDAEEAKAPRSPRPATRQDYERLAKNLAPLVRTELKKLLGKA